MNNTCILEIAKFHHPVYSRPNNSIPRACTKVVPIFLNTSTAQVRLLEMTVCAYVSRGSVERTLGNSPRSYAQGNAGVNWFSYAWLTERCDDGCQQLLLSLCFGQS